MALQADKEARGLGGAGVAEGRNVVLMSDCVDGADVLGLQETLRPLVELCLSPDAQTPFALALVGAPGVGKRFALRRLVEGVEALARGAAPGFVSKIVIARVVAAAAAGEDPAVAIAAATFTAFEAAGYAQLADEAAHATADPSRAASAAVERHDEAMRRLEQERAARDEVEARRARIAEALLFDTPGSRIDTFIRSSRARIESKLRRFGFGEGDAATNYRHLVRDLAHLGAASRPAVFLRAMWAYRGQKGLIVLAIFALLLALGLDRLRGPGVPQSLPALGAQLAPALDAVAAHAEQVQYAVDALLVGGFAALFANIWRAVSFTGLLFRGLKLLNIDIRERRTELDASAARLERRVAALQIEADAANQRAETLARRAGGGAGPSTRPPGPLFVRSPEAPTRAARDFMRELPRAMSAAAVPAPQRLLLIIDNVDPSRPAEARRLLEVAVQLAGPGIAVVAAFDPTRLEGDPREIVEGLFQIAFDVGALGAEQNFAARLLSASPSTPVGDPGSRRSGLAEPLDEAETRALTSAGALVGPNPRALKRFFNAYRLARLGDAPRPLVALALAARMGVDSDAAPALCWTLFSDGEVLAAPSSPPALAAAFRAVVSPSTDKAAAQRAWALAKRYSPWPL